MLKRGASFSNIFIFMHRKKTFKWPYTVAVGIGYSKIHTLIMDKYPTRRDECSFLQGLKDALSDGLFFVNISHGYAKEICLDGLHLANF